MAATDYKVPTIVIPFPNQDGSMTVRGLNLDDMAILLEANLEPISLMVEEYQQNKSNFFDRSNLTTFLMLMARRFPNLLSEVISVAADEPAAVGVKFALGVQIAALTAIIKLTLEEVGGLGNLFAILAALSQGALQNVSELSQNLDQSRGSTGELERT